MLEDQIFSVRNNCYSDSEVQKSGSTNKKAEYSRDIHGLNWNSEEKKWEG